MRMGIDNTPSDLTHLVNLTHLAIHILQPCRDEFGVITVNSSHRSPDLNKAWVVQIGVNIVMDRTADFESFKIPNPDLAEWIRDNLEFDQLILEFYDGKDPNGGGYTVVTISWRIVKSV